MFQKNDLSDNFSDDIRNEPKKRTRKSKKQNEKEILYEYKAEVEREKENTLIKQKKIYENMQYLSDKEKQQFEKKMTYPKNISQERYCILLRDKSMMSWHKMKRRRRVSQLTRAK
jgi:hypothetical protein